MNREERLPLDALKPNPKNPKGHDLGAIIISLRAHGFVDAPILDDRTGLLLGGHGRVEALLAMQKAGDKPPAGVEVRGGKWCIRVQHARSRNDGQANALMLALNRTVEKGGSDDERLAALLKELHGSGDLDTSGYDGDDLDDLLKQLGKDDEEEDEIPDPPKKPVTRRGDLWTLGDHRLLCGDSTKPEDVSRTMGKDRAMLMATDPPYMVEYGGWHSAAARKSSDKIEKKDWTETYKEVTPEQLKAALGNGVNVSAEGVAIYVWHSDSRAAELRTILDDLGVLWHQTIIWTKPSGIPTHCVYMQQHEPCAFGWMKGTRARMARGGQGTAGAGYNWTTVWAIDWDGAAKPPGERGHPTMKPTEISIRPMQLHTKPGDVVYEPFSGSGTQIIAAEKTGRRCRAIEIEPAYVDVAVQRWEQFTKKKATRQKA